MLKDVYGGEASAERKLIFPDQLSCSLDLATGTGKSYVMYGIAALMLATGAVDQVLVLCPSLTIEAGLTESSRASRRAKRCAPQCPRVPLIRRPRSSTAPSR